MNLKSIFIVTLLILAAYYIAPFIDGLFSINTDYCERYDVYTEDEYVVGYGDRLKAVSEGCY
jgi:hypothetical protein